MQIQKSHIAEYNEKSYRLYTNSVQKRTAKQCALITAERNGPVQKAPGITIDSESVASD